MDHTNGYVDTLDQPSNGHPPTDTIDPGPPATGDDRPSDTPPAAEVSDGQPARKRNRTRAARRAGVTVPGDLPAVLQRHLAGMGPAEALHAIEALGRLGQHLASTGPAVTSEFLRLAMDETDGCRVLAAVHRLQALLADLLPIVANPDQAAAVAPVLAYAHARAAADAEKEAEQNRRRRK